MQRLLMCPQLVRALAEVWGRAYAAEAGRSIKPGAHVSPAECRQRAGNAAEAFLAKMREIELADPG